LSLRSRLLVSVIIPTFNGRPRIQNTLDALFAQDFNEDFEIIVLDDGSTDGTADFVRSYSPKIRVSSQPNQGPGAARNHGACQAQGEIVLFTDDDCVPEKNWLMQMLRPFAENPEVVGVKGRYRSEQPEIVARFVQLEYEDKYDYMAKDTYIDFIDTYSAGFRRLVFLESGGYDTEFPVACAEDIELSYRLSQKGYKMMFVSQAVVKHTHPARLLAYLKKKFKYAYWRVLALKKNPHKLVKDSHTPQLMKIQLLLAPISLGSLLLGLFSPQFWFLSILGFIGFGVTTIPFVRKAWPKDEIVALFSPLFLFARACAQGLGVAGGLWYLVKQRKPVSDNRMNYS
jgi:GT2 family glycosyltransferase